MNNQSSVLIWEKLNKFHLLFSLISKERRCIFFLSDVCRGH